MITYRSLGHEGRLGNQLWQIASTYGIAASRGDSALLPQWEYASVFNVPDGLFGSVPDDALEATETSQASIIPANHRPYLQNLALWSNVADTIREWFQPRANIQELVDQEYASLVRGHRTSVHVRRTDAVIKQQWFTVPDASYFMPAMQSIKDRTTFLVFSDDIRWCKDNLPSSVNGNPVVFVSPPLPDPARNYRGDPLGNQYDWREFHLMRACNRHITANSTYSWWAAWLSDDVEPITPARWYGPLYVNQIDLDGFLPANWIRM